ncbi:MAG TPA: hypothetical protein O0X64_02300 [Methanocorpusculum sp.]|nr:hypothetical protein [Methanocorpusculum sp.]
MLLKVNELALETLLQCDVDANVRDFQGGTFIWYTNDKLEVVVGILDTCDDESKLFMETRLLQPVVPFFSQHNFNHLKTKCHF